jgi:predicted ArsR family transcriptional regulator
LARGRVVDQLRRAPQTVEELARILGITGNAVRSHLSTLEREELGGIVEVVNGENGDGPFVIRGLSCPLGAVVRSYPQVCAAVESLVAEITQARAQETCPRGAEPRCRIEVTPRSSGSTRERPRDGS